MSCATCKRKAAAERCEDGYLSYLAGEFPCPHNPDPLALPRNLIDLAPLTHTRNRISVEDTENRMSAEGLEDLL